MNRYFSEFLGTFCLVFAGTGAIIANDAFGGVVTHPGIALSFGLVVMAVIYAIGDVSGAHINPAVTFGFYLLRVFPAKDLFPYIASQCAGATAASGLLWWAFASHETLGATLPAVPVATAFVFEFVLTFILMFVIIHVSEGAKEKGLMAGIAVGGTVALEAMFAGPITGASMNPARSLGPALVSGHLEFLWIFLTAPFAGVVLAGFTCRLIRGKDCCK